MRAGIAVLIILTALIGSGVAAGLLTSWGIGRAPIGHLLSCELLGRAERQRMLDPKQRDDIVAKVIASGKLSSAAARAAADLRSNCPA